MTSNYPPANQSPSEPAKREPAIRTMKSDMAEYLKTTKPSLVSILARQAEADEARQSQQNGGPKKSELKAALAIFLTLVSLAAGFLGYLYLKREKPPTTKRPEATPAALMFYEKSSEVLINENRREFTQALNEKAKATTAAGTFHRLTLRLRNKEGTDPVIGIRQFFELADAKPPEGFLDTIVEPPQLFIYRQGDGPRLSILLKSDDLERALESMRRWESALPTSFAFAFFGEGLPVTLEPFSSRTYKNIDFRYLKMEADRDRGAGYLAFPAKRLIIIATSEEAIRLTINRLFENR